jgi:hypothetical protein
MGMQYEPLLRFGTQSVPIPIPIYALGYAERGNREKIPLDPPFSKGEVCLTKFPLLFNRERGSCFW